VRFLLDEDLPPRSAEIARAHGLEAVSVHEIGRRGLGDDEQLDFAAAERRVLVTRNRDDFIRLTVARFRTATPHAGVLIVARSLPNHRPEVIAGALAEWASRYRESGHPLDYTLDFLGG